MTVPIPESFVSPKIQRVLPRSEREPHYCAMPRTADVEGNVWSMAYGVW